MSIDLLNKDALVESNELSVLKPRSYPIEMCMQGWKNGGDDPINTISLVNANSSNEKNSTIPSKNVAVQRKD